MGVKLRKRKLTKGRECYYLDIWHNQQRIRETLFVVEPNDNKRDKKELAETIARQRADEIQSQGTKYIPKHKRKTTLHSYLNHFQDTYTKKDYRVIEAVILKIKEFEPSTLFLISEIDENFIIKFIDYLNFNAGLKGETPKTYFRRFKKIILQANRDNLIEENTYKGVQFKSRNTDSSKTLVKEVLNEDEIEKLFITPCGNNEVKRAFLLACYSGIGYAEAKILKWANLSNGRLKINRCKTNELIDIQLSPVILIFLGSPQDSKEPIFSFFRNGKYLTENSVNKTLKNWIKKAEINKKITFYCGRHSYGTRLLIKGANLKSVSDAMAHKSIETTTKYLNYVNSLKDEATSNL